MPNEYEEICKRHAEMEAHQQKLFADDPTPENQGTPAHRDRGFLLNMIEELEQQL
jgi:hypothetical protein